MEVTYRGVKIIVKHGSILEEDVDAIVNPANSAMFMGGGVAGAIKRAAGVEVEAEALKHAPVPIGKAIATSAGKLNAKYVIHTPTMITPGPTDAQNVYEATKAALECANSIKVGRIAIPGMGTGVGGLSPGESGNAMLQAVKQFVEEWGGLETIILLDLNEEVVKKLRVALQNILR